MSDPAASPSFTRPATRFGALAGVFPGWWIVGASTVGIMTGQSAVAFLPLGVFIKPLSDEFGWGRGDVAAALSMGAIALAVATPFAGRLIDRIGARRVMLPSIVVYGVLLSSLTFLTNSLWHFYAIFLLIGVLGTGANNVSYVRVISAWFNARRGLALGIASAGVPIGHAIATYLAQNLIEIWDWRVAYSGLGAFVLFFGLPIVYLIIRDSPADMGLEPLGGSEARNSTMSDAFGVSRREAVRMPVFWALVASAFLMATAFHGFQIHLIPFLTDMGISPLTAAGMLTFLTTSAALVGRVGAGYLFDHFFAPRVTIFVFLIPIVGLLFIYLVPSFFAAVVVVILLGFGAGAESDVLGYMTSRYFGLRSMGELYAYVFAGFMGGTAVGPYVYGVVYDTYGSYDFSLLLSIVLLFVVCAMMVFFPRFPTYGAARIEGTVSEPA